MKNYQWHKIAESVDELPWSPGGLLEWEVAGKLVCLSKHQDQLSGCAAKCPHAGARMSEGYHDAMGHIVCPLHRYKFDLRNGRNVSGEGYYLRPYPVEVRDEGVYVGIEEKSGLFG